jgi:flagellar basal-body rod modification protein FlgD
VRSPAGTRFDGSPITLTTPALADAETAELLIRDQSGRIVDRQAVAIRGGEVTWNGIAQTGDRFLTGQYSFAVEGRAQGQVLYERPVEAYATVSEARVGPSGGVELVLDGGATVAPDRVSALRQAGG